MEREVQAALHAVSRANVTSLYRVLRDEPVCLLFWRPEKRGGLNFTAPNRRGKAAAGVPLPGRGGQSGGPGSGVNDSECAGKPQALKGTDVTPFPFLKAPLATSGETESSRGAGQG